MEKIKFQTKIIQHKTMNAAYVEFPFSTEKLFGKKGQVKVKVLFDNSIEYRGSLANMGQGCHILVITQAIRKQLQKTFGDDVLVVLWEDKEERVVEVPDDVNQILTENLQAKEFFESLSYTHRKEYVRWINDAKKDETRDRRKIKMIELLLQGKKGI